MEKGKVQQVERPTQRTYVGREQARESEWWQGTVGWEWEQIVRGLLCHPGVLTLTL